MITVVSTVNRYLAANENRQAMTFRQQYRCEALRERNIIWLIIRHTGQR